MKKFGVLLLLALAACASKPAETHMIDSPMPEEREPAGTGEPMLNCSTRNDPSYTVQIHRGEGEFTGEGLKIFVTVTMADRAMGMQTLMNKAPGRLLSGRVGYMANFTGGHLTLEGMNAGFGAGAPGNRIKSRWKGTMSLQGHAPAEISCSGNIR